MNILIKNAVAVVTCSSKQTKSSEERRGNSSNFFYPNSLYIEDGIIKEVGYDLDMPADRIIDASGKIEYSSSSEHGAF